MTGDEIFVAIRREADAQVDPSMIGPLATPFTESHDRTLRIQHHALKLVCHRLAELHERIDELVELIGKKRSCDHCRDGVMLAVEHKDGDALRCDRCGIMCITIAKKPLPTNAVAAFQEAMKHLGSSIDGAAITRELERHPGVVRIDRIDMNVVAELEPYPAHVQINIAPMCSCPTPLAAGGSGPEPICPVHGRP